MNSDLDYMVEDMAKKETTDVVLTRRERLVFESGLKIGAYRMAIAFRKGVIE